MEVDSVAGAARRRRERRLQQFLRRERLSDHMTFAEFVHHSATRGRRMARAGKGEVGDAFFFTRDAHLMAESSLQPVSGESSDDCARGGDTSSSRSLRPCPRSSTIQPCGEKKASVGEVEEQATHVGLRAQKAPSPGERPGILAEPWEEDNEVHFTATFRANPPPQAAGTEYFSLDVEEVPAAGSRPDRLPDVSRPQERVLRHTMEQLADCAGRAGPRQDVRDRPFSRRSCAVDGGQLRARAGDRSAQDLARLHPAAYVALRAAAAGGTVGGSACHLSS